MNQNSTSARSWGTIVTHSDEMAIIYRYVDTFHDDWDLSSQPDRIIIAWRYEDETGMPSPNEREHMEELEAALAPRPKFPIEIRSAADPAWSTYAGFMAALPQG